MLLHISSKHEGGSKVDGVSQSVPTSYMSTDSNSDKVYHFDLISGISEYVLMPPPAPNSPLACTEKGGKILDPGSAQRH